MVTIFFLLSFPIAVFSVRFASLTTAIMDVQFQRDIRVEDADHLLKSLDSEDTDATLAGFVAEQVQKYVHCFVLYFGFLYYGSILIGGFLFQLMRRKNKL